MDKEPSLLSIWAVALVLGLAGCLAWTRQVVLGVTATAIASVLAIGLCVELLDPFVGPAIIQETGRGYVVQVYLAILACAALHMTGFKVRHRRARAVTARA